MPTGAKLRNTVLVLGLAMAGPAHAFTDRVTLGAVRDNTLYESATGALSNGAGFYFFAGSTGPFATDSIRRGILAFALADSIPPGSAIDSVAVILHMSRTTSGAQSVALHRVLADWGEGTSQGAIGEGMGGPATPGDATWIHRFFDTQFWAVPGGDFVAAPSAAISVVDTAFYTWGTAGLVSDVQGWLDDPASNFGWLVRGNEAVLSTSKRFDSRQNPIQAFRPRLFVQFRTPTNALAPSPRALGLRAAFPNPFNPGTTLLYELSASGFVLLRIHDVEGRIVRTLVSRLESPGVHEVHWDGRDAGGRRLGSGVYFCVLRAAGVSDAKRLVRIE